MFDFAGTVTATVKVELSAPKWNPFSNRFVSTVSTGLLTLLSGALVK